MKFEAFKQEIQAKKRKNKKMKTNPELVEIGVFQRFDDEHLAGRWRQVEELPDGWDGCSASDAHRKVGDGILEHWTLRHEYNNWCEMEVSDCLNLENEEFFRSFIQSQQCPNNLKNVLLSKTLKNVFPFSKTISRFQKQFPVRSENYL